VLAMAEYRRESLADLPKDARRAIRDPEFFRPRTYSAKIFPVCPISIERFLGESRCPPPRNDMPDTRAGERRQRLSCCAMNRIEMSVTGSRIRLERAFGDCKTPCVAIRQAIPCLKMRRPEWP
jgi:hypothetical protein